MIFWSRVTGLHNDAGHVMGWVNQEVMNQV